jgi:hypothetical protein
VRIRFISVTLAVCAACVFDIPQSRAPAEPQQEEAIDFDALHAQAAAALNVLQQSNERQLASVGSRKF